MLTNLSNTSGQPNSVVVIQQGLQVQPVVLVDQYGSAVTISGGGSSGTATALATLTTPVVVSGATAPTTGQVLTAVSASVATWQNSASGFSNPMTTAGDLIDATTGGAAQRLGIGTVGQVLTVSASTVPTWASASSFTNPMTTPGDIIYENSSTAPTRLAGNTSTQREFLLSQGSGSAASAPTWSVVSGQYLATPNQYAPGTQAIFTGTTATMAPVYSSSINTGSFIVPPSGIVVVTASFTWQATATGTELAFGLAAHNTTSPIIGYVPVGRTGNASEPVFQVMEWLVSTLTAGSAYTLDLMYCASGGNIDVLAFSQSSTAPTLSSGGWGSPVAMKVQAV